MSIRSMGGLAVWLCGLLACGDSRQAERVAQNARIEALEQRVQRLSEAVSAQEGLAKHPFRAACPQPWVLHTPLGSTLWSCRSASATPEGIYPQCSVTFQPQAAIETRGYFEFALNAAPPLRAAEQLKDQHVTLRGSEAFEATFEMTASPVALKALSVLVPWKERTYAITCSAPQSAYDKLVPAFRRIIDSFGFD